MSPKKATGLDHSTDKYLSGEVFEKRYMVQPCESRYVGKPPLK